MNYSKPKVKTLGDAKTVIEKMVKQAPPSTEPVTREEFNPACDLDE